MPVVTQHQDTVGAANISEGQQIGKYEWILLTALSLGAAGLRFYRLGSESFWRDELIQATVAEGANSWWQAMVLSSTSRGSTPLDYLVTYGMLHLGREEAVLRIPAALFGVAAVVLLYFVGKKLFSPAVGITAASMLALTHLHIYYSQEMRPYSLATFLFLLAFYLFLQAISKNRIRDWVGLSLVAALALYTHYYMGLLIMALGLWALFLRRDILKRLVVSLGLSVGLFVPWIYFDIFRRGALNPRPEELDTSGILPAFLNELTIGQGAPCELPCLPPNWRGVLIAAALVLSLLVFVIKRGKTGRSLFLLYLILLVGIPGVLVLNSVGEYFFAVRQILVWVPFFLLAASVVVLLVPRYFAAYLVLFMVVFYGVISAPSVASMYEQQTKEDFRGAAVFLEENVAPDDIIFVKKPVHLTYYIPELSEHIYAERETSQRVRSTLIDLSQNNHSAWFVLWGENPRAYEEGWAGIRRRGVKVFERPRVIMIPPAEQR